MLLIPPLLGWPLWNICVTNDHGYVLLVVNTSRSFPRSWLINGFVTRLTRQVSLVEQELLTLPEHLSSHPVFSGIRVTWSLVLICMFCRSLFVLFLLAIVLSVLLLRYTDSEWLPLWYLQTLLACKKLWKRFRLPVTTTFTVQWRYKMYESLFSSEKNNL